MTIRLRTKEDFEGMDQAGEIQDGLFSFCAQGEHIVDCALFITDLECGESKEYYTVNVWTRREDAPERSLYNFTMIGKSTLADVNDLCAEYFESDNYVCDTKEEMIQQYAKLCSELNHF